MQYVEQHSYRENKEKNSNGCQPIVKKDGLLDSLDVSANGSNFTIRKLNLMFVFVVVVWIFFLIIHDPKSCMCFLCIM